MRYLLTIIMAAFLATPALADTQMCSINGPHNCQEQIEDYLVAGTQNAVHSMQLSRPGHAFQTQNDKILEQAARNHAQLDYNRVNTTPLYK